MGEDQVGFSIFESTLPAFGDGRAESADDDDVVVLLLKESLVGRHVLY